MFLKEMLTKRPAYLCKDSEMVQEFGPTTEHRTTRGGRDAGTVEGRNNDMHRRGIAEDDIGLFASDQ